MTAIGTTEPMAGDYILTGFRDEAERMAACTGHARRSPFSGIRATPTRSSPLFSAFRRAHRCRSWRRSVLSFGDFEGLALWAANAAPWLYLEASGLLRRPEDLRSEKRDVPRETAARYNFGLYMLCVGGLPLFVTRSRTGICATRLFTRERSRWSAETRRRFFFRRSRGEGALLQGPPDVGLSLFPSQ